MACEQMLTAQLHNHLQKYPTLNWWGVNSKGRRVWAKKRRQRAQDTEKNHSRGLESSRLVISTTQLKANANQGQLQSGSLRLIKEDSSNLQSEARVSVPPARFPIRDCRLTTPPSLLVRPT